MTSYFKIAIKALFSANSDYSEPMGSFNPAAFTESGTNEFLHHYVEADNGGEVVELGRFDGGIKYCIIKSTAVAATVTATFNTAAGSTTVVIPADGLFVTPDINYANDLTLTTSSGTHPCEVFVFGT